MLKCLSHVTINYKEVNYTDNFLKKPFMQHPLRWHRRKITSLGASCEKNKSIKFLEKNLYRKFLEINLFFRDITENIIYAQDFHAIATKYASSYDWLQMPETRSTIHKVKHWDVFLWLLTIIFCWNLYCLKNWIWRNGIKFPLKIYVSKSEKNIFLLILLVYTFHGNDFAV